MCLGTVECSCYDCLQQQFETWAPQSIIEKVKSSRSESEAQSQEDRPEKE